MKNKSTLTFYTFLLSCCLSLIINAQDKKPNNDFSFHVIKYSDKPNFEKEHLHVIELKNNSQLTSQYTISIINDRCPENGANHKKASLINKKKESNIGTEIYLIDFGKKQQINNVISLKPNESMKIYLKTKQKINAKLDSRNCSVIRATKVPQNKSKGSKYNLSKSITIETIVRNPINKGH